MSLKEQIPLKPNEEIKPIIGYEGLYSVTSFGRVWMYTKIVRNRKFKSKWMSLRFKKEDYVYVYLSKEGRRKMHSVHILVAQAFIPNPNNLPEVNHKDGDKWFNYKKNLEWCTHLGNMHHATVSNLLKYKKFSKYKGVTSSGSKKNPYRVQIPINGKSKNVGSFNTEKEAFDKYCECRIGVCS